MTQCRPAASSDHDARPARTMRGRSACRAFRSRPSRERRANPGVGIVVHYGQRQSPLPQRSLITQTGVDIQRLSEFPKCALERGEPFLAAPSSRSTVTPTHRVTPLRSAGTPSRKLISHCPASRVAHTSRNTTSGTSPIRKQSGDRHGLELVYRCPHPSTRGSAASAMLPQFRRPRLAFYPPTEADRLESVKRVTRKQQFGGGAASVAHDVDCLPALDVLEKSHVALDRC